MRPPFELQASTIPARLTSTVIMLDSTIDLSDGTTGREHSISHGVHTAHAQSLPSNRGDENETKLVAVVTLSVLVHRPLVILI